MHGTQETEQNTSEALCGHGYETYKQLAFEQNLNSLFSPSESAERYTPDL